MNPDGTGWPQMLVGKVAVDLIDHEHAMSLMIDSSSKSHPLAVVSANLHHIHFFADEHPFQSDNGLSWLTLLDGVPLVRSADALTGGHWPKLAGSDLIVPVLEAAAHRGLRVGFLGGEARTHGRLREVLGQRLPELTVSGTWSPSRAAVIDPASSEQIAAEIRAAAVDILFVSLGKPLQEHWIACHGPSTGARLLLAFGAAPDFVAGRHKRAPRLVANAGAEWAWRLLFEPRRLARRYLIDCPPALVRLKRTATVREPTLHWDRDGAVAPGTFVEDDARADVAVITVTYNSALDIAPLIDDLRRDAKELAVRLVVVDNGSADDTVGLVGAHHDVVLAETRRNLGYAGGINVGLSRSGPCDNVLILNPDLRLAPNAIANLLASTDGDRVGAVVPLIVDADWARYPSLRREPSLTRAVFDALLGSKMWAARPGWSSEFVSSPTGYAAAGDVDWATGAAVLIPTPVARELGPWSEEFFLYSEETDYFRRIRESGRRVRFDPAAVVAHSGAGSGSSPDLWALLVVNRVRYVERRSGRAYSALFRLAVALGEALRSYDPVRRRTLAIVLNRRRWADLPRATESSAQQELSGPRHRGAVIVPAYNEASVIRRTLMPLSKAATDGYFELIVVCNGCVDDTADVARTVPGARVLELEQGSKPAALNSGDAAATLWPRIYLDADIQITAPAVLAVLDRLELGDVLIARPDFRTDTRAATAPVRSYFRVRGQIAQHKAAMWGAGMYGLSEKGHARFGEFPPVTSDDRFVDTRFDPDEKTVVACDPAIVTTPTNAKTLIRVLGRTYRGSAELLASETGPEKRDSEKGLGTVASVFGLIRGPRTAVDAAVYLGVALAARIGRRREAGPWEQDVSSR